MFNRLRTLLSADEPALYAVLDVGTSEVKALVVLVEGEQASIVGVGREAHHPNAVRGGAIADVQGVNAACETALTQAETLTETVVGEKLVADRAILSVSGSLLKSTYLSLVVQRSRPSDRIAERELKTILQRAERLALQKARHDLALETAQPNVAVGLVDAEIVQVLVDGYRVSSPLRLQGQQLEVRVFNIFAPLTYLTTVGSVATALDLQAVAILAGACAAGRAVARGDAIIADVGGACTDVALRRGGGIEGLRTLPMGGLSFTRTVGRTLGIPLGPAEEMKKNYAAGLLDQDRSADLRLALASDAHTWVDGVQTLLEEMTGEESLPPRILLCGGGAALPDLVEAARSHPWGKHLPFRRPPEVAVLHPASVPGLRDRTGRLAGETFVVPTALAAWALPSARGRATSLSQGILNRVLNGMRLS